MEPIIETNPLVQLYGDNALDLAAVEIQELAKVSNIPFTKEYMQIGSSFTLLNAKEIIAGKAKECSLKNLISKSFGEAAIYQYNIAGK